MTISQQQNLEIKQAQSIVMTEALQQSIKILQLSSLELNSLINSELEKNPLLSAVENDSENNLSQSIETEENNHLENHLSKEGYENTWTNSDNSINQLSNSSLIYSNARKITSDNNDALDKLDLSSSDKTLKEHIMEQIYLSIDEPIKKMVALHLMDNLDDNGYLEQDLFEFSLNLNCPLDLVIEVLELVQSFEPAGTFSRSLAECLKLQLIDKNRYDPAIGLLLANLDLLAQGKIKELQSLCEVNQEDLEEMILEVKRLNPKPGSKFIKESTYYMIPDVFLIRNGKGEYLLELNTQVLPKLLVDRHYYSKIKNHSKNKSELKYISEQFYNANTLIKALDQRAQTILKVSTEIVLRQRQFFEQGIMHLKPLTLKIIAEATSLHESTVSRITTNKYIATPRGIFELKYFFSSSLNNENDEETSSTSIKYLIKNIIDKEGDKIYSDEKLVSVLKERNITIARRTIAKYREEMNIPSSAIRKSSKKLSKNKF